LSVKYYFHARPRLPGSGGRGGGLVRISARVRMRIGGTISANGMNRLTVGTCGAGSGGGILLTAQSFSGSETGMLRANGGTVANAGGGGRISVLTPFQSFDAVQALAGSEALPSSLCPIDPADWIGWEGSPPSVTGYHPGSVFFGRIVAGTLFHILKKERVSGIPWVRRTVPVSRGWSAE
jgi:hypothetical protein